MAYIVELKPSAFRSLAKLPKEDQRIIRSRIDALASNPFPPNVKKLERIENLYRLRVGDYRVIYQVQKKILLILVVAIGHRKEIYRQIHN